MILQFPTKEIHVSLLTLSPIHPPVRATERRLRWYWMPVEALPYTGPFWQISAACQLEQSYPAVLYRRWRWLCFGWATVEILDSGMQQELPLAIE